MKNILLIIAVLVSSFSYSQISTFTYEGYIFDENKQAIPFANIMLTDKNKITTGATTDFDGYFLINNISIGVYDLKVSCFGYASKEFSNYIFPINKIDSFYLEPKGLRVEEVMIISHREPLVDAGVTSYSSTTGYANIRSDHINYNAIPDFAPIPDYENDSISKDFILTEDETTSTFSIDVDNASYTHLRNTILNYNQAPDSSNVRIEEMINYFNYNYPSPKGKEIFSVYSETGSCPWNDNAKLLHIGIQGKNINYDELDESNLVFLIDVSGSMSSSIELIKKSLNLLVDELTERDNISIVVYAGAAGEVLSSTPANEKEKIKNAINNLKAGGSTAGGAGINLAYKIAKENFKTGANNRVILCTDGDFNVGISSRDELIKLIEEKRKNKIFLSVCGFGYALHRDNEMESIADKGNGNYYFIDSEKEANNVFVKKMRATLFTIAKDVKIQMVFNKDAVESYRLIGYTNRKLDNKDFKNDKKDAGELGAGQNVTAIYEIILKKENVEENLANIRLRYKDPEKSKSKLSEFYIKNQIVSEIEQSISYNFSTAVAAFGMLLEKKETSIDLSIKNIKSLALKSIAEHDKENREEFIKILDVFSQIQKISSQTNFNNK